MGPDRFQLRSINSSSFPNNPTHPRLVERAQRAGEQRPPLSPDGTYGDRDWLFNTINYQRNRVWLHYIPTQSMWGEGFRGWKPPPIYWKPAQFGDGLWLQTGPTGRFGAKLLTDLKRFHDIGVRHALELRQTAVHYTRMPLYGDRLKWDSIQGEGTYPQMLINLVDLQCAIAELFGWIFLQEKMQPTVPSMVPRPTAAPIDSTAPIPRLDHFTGVIVEWAGRTGDFECMAMSHGVAVWHVDYISDPQSEIAPWKGLAQGGTIINTHRGAGYALARKTDIVQMHSARVDEPGVAKTSLDAVLLAETARPPRVPPPRQSSRAAPAGSASGQSSVAAPSASEKIPGAAVATGHVSTSGGLPGGVKRPRAQGRPSASDFPDSTPDSSVPGAVRKRKRKNHYSQRQRREMKAAAAGTGTSTSEAGGPSSA
ncbi:hypothetical protein BOTBODRAFT_178448 [Botryobasidium botryosum FD-172 SS1]|uniref:Uncharacterized protein n=1 Tax=Botryobasidium botryosum (strain FD-172 SS1) TaxID=930990 RepID=A0A067M3C6_BOTB1|nr:hypothetical protein BOTBODRAFT_178448 [Botryobasidium botryosum FD-172 SS1]